MRRRQTQTGFTIIELVVVILLLGILTATALPRFIDVTDEAHAAVVDAVEGGLATGVAMGRAQWFANNRPIQLGAGDFAPNPAGMSPNGFPSGLANSNVTSNTDCDQVFSDVLQGGRPTTTTIANNGPTAPLVSDLTYGADPFNVAHSATGCYYIYTAQGSAFSAPVILYDSSTGEVSRGTSI